MIVLSALLAVASIHVSAQELSLASICEGQVPARTVYEADRLAYADDFCALAAWNKLAAARQLSKAVALVRRENNPNRYYFDERVHGPTPEGQRTYLQLLSSEAAAVVTTRRLRVPALRYNHDGWASDARSTRVLTGAGDMIEFYVVRDGGLRIRARLGIWPVFASARPTSTSGFDQPRPSPRSIVGIYDEGVRNLIVFGRGSFPNERIGPIGEGVIVLFDNVFSAQSTTDPSVMFVTRLDYQETLQLYLTACMGALARDPSASLEAQPGCPFPDY